MLRRGRSFAVAGVCTIVLAACGSQVAPRAFYDGGGVGARLSAQPSAGASTRVGQPAESAAGGSGRVLAPTGGALVSGDPGTGDTVSPGGPSGATTSQANTAPTGGSSAVTNGNPSGVVVGSCAGFTNTTGITDSDITVANSSDLSGPIAGLFVSAQQAVKAYLDYFDSTSSICGRKIKLTSLDSQTSATGNLQAETTACGQAFALVGSMSAYDNGGAAAGASCGIPDLRAIAVNPGRADSPVSFGTDSLAIPQVPTSPYVYIKNTQGDAYQHAAIVYLNIGATTINGHSFEKAEEAIGFRFVYSQALSVTEFNYAPYVAAMVNKGVKYVQWVGNYQNAVNFIKAMNQQNFHPVIQMDSVAYDPGFGQQGGSAVNGVYSFVDTDMFEEASKSPEMRLYLKWLNIVAPGAHPSFFGVFAWGAARLFTEKAIELGGKLTRASLIAALKQVTNYTGNGLFAPMQIGPKTTPSCQTEMQLENGVWVRRTPYPFACGSVVNTGIGK
jgi:ABC-type branched-subunit amino acid transport system substrate-binding protein